MSNPDYPHMEQLSKLSDLVDECAQAWHAVGQSEMSALGDPSLPYRKREALNASKALKDAIYEAIPLDADYEPVPLTPGKTVKTRYVYTGTIPARELPADSSDQL